ncbi:MAG: hypothetical protein COA96_03630 [SAR86 cluster bacterium]|uniref:Polysaccharide chain length determinant N-terminal domain-containing protein n=1 Tax=SAR86 cluster bacterium TaxID=2030880 RepID=A0A2A5B6T7_9GAMM|nr:MAG: hypothetical protein COA96_03630 [SAR86 cluster bacterium]
MNLHVEDMIKSYLRALSENRILVAACILAVSVSCLLLAATWPKSFTASASIYADNSNILQPLMEGNAVTTGIVDQARMAQDILFNRDFADLILESGGWDVDILSQAQKDELIGTVQGHTIIANVSRNPASLIKISHTDESPIRAFSITQRYTSLFIKQSVVAKQEESRNAFGFIENQVASYQTKLQESERKLSLFKSEHNLGTLTNSNNRISGYRAEMERLELDLVQVETEIRSVESQLAGENAVSKDLSEINAIRGRINALQIVLDGLRARFHDNYPDVVQVQNQISDLQGMLESDRISPIISTELDEGEGVTPLHQELRSQLAALKTSSEAMLSQHSGISVLLAAEEERSKLINESEAELAELTRDYNVTQDFYNEMLQRLENARVSMHLDEEEQGVTFKIQESAVIPTQPDGFTFSQLMMGSIILALCAPIGLLIVYMELDTRIKSESNWSESWPPMLITIPHMQTENVRRVADRYFTAMVAAAMVSIYGITWYLNLAEFF